MQSVSSLNSQTLISLNRYGLSAYFRKAVCTVRDVANLLGRPLTLEDIYDEDSVLEAVPGDSYPVAAERFRLAARMIRAITENFAIDISQIEEALTLELRLQAVGSLPRGEASALVDLLNMLDRRQRWYLEPSSDELVRPVDLSDVFDPLLSGSPRGAVRLATIAQPDAMDSWIVAYRDDLCLCAREVSGSLGLGPVLVTGLSESSYGDLVERLFTEMYDVSRCTIRLGVHSYAELQARFALLEDDNRFVDLDRLLDLFQEHPEVETSEPIPT